MSIVSCNIHDSQCLEDASTRTATTKATTCVSHAEDIMSELVDIDYVTVLDNDSAIYEILVTGTAYHTSNKNITTAKHLFKIRKISQENTQRTIDNKNQRFVRQEEPSLKWNYNTNDRMLRHERLDKTFYMDIFYAEKAKSMKVIR